MTKCQNLYDFYNDIFEGVLANTEELRKECYKIRYEVYCIEHSGYEDPAAFPDGCEHDEHDAHAVHALLRHRETGIFVGTVRLILHSIGSITGIPPVYNLCSANGLVMPEAFPRQNIAEVSRFCIIRDFRRRVVDTIASSSYTKDELLSDKLRIVPSMSLGLIAMLVLMSKQNTIKQWCAEMEPFLIQLLSKLGIYFEPVGPLVEYHGKRQICYRPLDALLNQVAKERLDVWEIITDRGRYCGDSKMEAFPFNGRGFEEAEDSMMDQSLSGKRDTSRLG